MHLSRSYSAGKKTNYPCSNGSQCLRGCFLSLGTDCFVFIFCVFTFLCAATAVCLV